MSEKEPEIIARARAAKRETDVREEIARGLWTTGKNLLLKERERVGTELRFLKTIFGEGEGTVEVTISPRNWRRLDLYEQNLTTAVMEVQIGKGPAFYLISPSGRYGGRWELPDGKTLTELEELMTAIEERVPQKSAA